MKERGRVRGQSQRDVRGYYAAGSEDGRGLRTKECGQPPQAGRGKHKQTNKQQNNKTQNRFSIAASRKEGALPILA